MPLNEEQRRHLEGRLREERERLRRDLGITLREQSSQDAEQRTGDVSLMPTHMADRGTDTFDDEVATANAARMSRELEAIDAALDRLDRDPEHFGVCEDTGRDIPFGRLDIVPWARTCEQAGA